MLEILQNIITILTTDSILNAIVPVTNIFTGPVDVVNEQQLTLLYPQIQLHVLSESINAVPSNTRSTQLQISIFSRNNQLETINIYERLVTLLNYNSSQNPGTYDIFWEKVGGCSDQFESDRRIWHRAVTVDCWAQKPLTA